MTITSTSAGQPISLGNDTQLCQGQTYVLQATGPYTTYKWQDNSTDSIFTVTSAGIYSVTVTNASGCSASGSVNIFYITQPRVFTLATDTAYCGNFGRILNTGVTNTLWSTGVTAPQITITSPGTYWAQETNACGTGSDTITVIQNLLPNVFIGPDTTLCTGQTLLLNAANANLTYSWQDGSTNPTYNVTTAGNYSVTVTNTSNCTASSALQVNYTTSPAQVNIGNDTAYCGPFSSVLTTGVANTIWSTGVTAPQITITSPGVYWAQESNGCGTGADTITITQNLLPNVFLGTDTTLCTGQTLLLTAANANLTYTWQDGSTNATFNVTAAGTYSVTVTNTSNCTASATLQVSFDTLPALVNIGNDTGYCGNFSRILYGSTPNTFWSTGQTSAQITVTTAGSYWAMENNGCGTNADTINITQNPFPIVNLGNDTTLCLGQTLMLNASNPNSNYQWQDNSTGSTYNVTSGGLYSVTVTTAFSCTTTDAIQINYNTSKPVFSLGGDTIYCQAFNQVLSTAVSNTLWSTNEVGPQITVNSPGVYWAQETNACGTTADSITIKQLTPPQISFTGTYSVCPGDTLSLTPTTNGSNFLWSTGENTQSIIVNHAGTFTVETWNDIACPQSASANVVQGGLPIFSLGGDTSVCSNEGILLSPNVANAHYVWQDNTVDTFYQATESGTYSVTITNNCGSSSAQKRVEMYRDECALLIPTGFSPNSDGKNDMFRAISRCPIRNFTIHIYNRWGQQVFESDDITIGWDGTFQERAQPLDVYVYYIEYFNYCKGAMDKRAGNVTLLR